MLQPARTESPMVVYDLSFADIPAVSDLAGRIWRAYYPAIISHEQIEFMLGWMYSADELQKQMEAGYRFWGIGKNRELAGFASASQEAEGKWHIHKFYIDTQLHRKGTGGILMQHILGAMHAREITLGVNRKNIPAINFYFRQGFSIDRVSDKDIGNGFVMEDFIMKRVA